MLINTNRLIMKPFSLELIDAALKHDRKLYKQLGIIPNDEWPEPDLVDAMDYFKTELCNNGITGFGSWIIINKKMEIVGSVGFLGEPSNSIVEIGFGIIPSQRRKGFCEESVNALINWAFKTKKINKVIAHCDVENSASFNILIKCGFMQIKSENGLIEWEYKKNT